MVTLSCNISLVIKVYNGGEGMEADIILYDTVITVVVGLSQY